MILGALKANRKHLKFSLHDQETGACARVRASGCWFEDARQEKHQRESVRRAAVSHGQRVQLCAAGEGRSRVASRVEVERGGVGGFQ